MPGLKGGTRKDKWQVAQFRRCKSPKFMAEVWWMIIIKGPSLLEQEHRKTIEMLKQENEMKIHDLEKQIR